MKNSKFLRSKNLPKSLKAEELKCLNDERGGFTLVELVITIAIVIILSVISVPIYRGYVEKAQLSEGYALLGTILSAQKAYYSEYGNFIGYANNGGGETSYNSLFGIDARGNKYFTKFQVSGAETSGKEKYYFLAFAYKPIELRANNGKSLFFLQYNITKGSIIEEGNAGAELNLSWR